MNLIFEKTASLQVVDDYNSFLKPYKVTNLDSALSCAITENSIKIKSVIEKENFAIKWLGLYELFPEKRIYQDINTDWVIMRLADDPLYLANGQSMILPTGVFRTLKKYADAKLHFDEIYIAHEIPKNILAPNTQDIPLELLIPPNPQNSVSSSELFVNFLRKLVTPAPRPIKTMDTYQYDPIIFGVVIFENTEILCPVGSWYYLAHWIW